MSDLAWLLGAALIMGLVYEFGGLPLFVIIGVAAILVFKALGDSAAKR